MKKVLFPQLVFIYLLYTQTMIDPLSLWSSAFLLEIWAWIWAWIWNLDTYRVSFGINGLNYTSIIAITLSDPTQYTCLILVWNARPGAGDTEHTQVTRKLEWYEWCLLYYGLGVHDVPSDRWWTSYSLLCWFHCVKWTGEHSNKSLLLTPSSQRHRVSL